jgi:hypothetical protein
MALAIGSFSKIYSFNSDLLIYNKISSSAILIGS